MDLELKNEIGFEVDFKKLIQIFYEPVIINYTIADIQLSITANKKIDSDLLRCADGISVNVKYLYIELYENYIYIHRCHS